MAILRANLAVSMVLSRRGVDVAVMEAVQAHAVLASPEVRLARVGYSRLAGFRVALFDDSLILTSNRGSSCATDLWCPGPAGGSLCGRPNTCLQHYTVAGGCRTVETLIEGAANCSRDSEASPPQAKPCASIMLLHYLHTYYLPVHVPVFTIYHFSLLKLLTSQHAIPRTIRHVL